MKGDKTRRGVRFTPSQIEWLENAMDQTGLDGSTIVRARFGDPKEFAEGSDDVENVTVRADRQPEMVGTTLVDGPRAQVNGIGQPTEISATAMSIELSTTPIYIPITASPATMVVEISMKPVKIPIVTVATEPLDPVHGSADGSIPREPCRPLRVRPVPSPEKKFIRLLARARQDLESERGTLRKVTQERDRALRELADLHHVHDDLLRQVDARKSAIATARHRQPHVEADGSGRAYVVVPARDRSGKRVLVRQRLHGWRLDRRRR